MFATHGLALSIKTHNGPQFVLEEFEVYPKDNNIERRTSTPVWPQANNHAERQNTQFSPIMWSKLKIITIQWIKSRICHWALLLKRKIIALEIWHIEINASSSASTVKLAKTNWRNFGGKRASGVLHKSELCLNRSKFRMQFCLGALNNVLYVFLLKFASFSKYYICKKPVLVVMSARDRKDGNFT